MKTLFNVSIASTMLLAGTAFSQTTWVESALWKAPQATSFTVSLLNKEKLADDCNFYRRVISYENETPSTISESAYRLAKYRKPFRPLVIELDIKPYVRVEKTVILEDDGSGKNDKLPHYTQFSSTTGAVINEAEDLKISGNGKSYTEISRKLGLTDSEIVLSMNDRARYVVTINGRDAACDLYEGFGHITMNAPSYVLLEQEGVTKLEEFYNKKLLPELNDLVALKSEGLVQKASRIGYRTGKVLEDEFSQLNVFVLEKQLVEIVKTLFNSKTLEPTSKLIKTDENLYLNLDGEAPGKIVEVKLEF